MRPLLFLLVLTLLSPIQTFAQPASVLDEPFSAASVDALAPPWQSAHLGATAPVAFAVEGGALVLEAAPGSPALAYTTEVLPTEQAADGDQVYRWAASFEADLTLSGWSGAEPMFGFMLGAPLMLMVNPAGEFALSGCDAQGCWDAAYADGLFAPKTAGAPLRLTLRYLPLPGDRTAHLALLVDGQLVLETWAPVLTEDVVGVFAGAGTRVEADRLTVRPLEVRHGDLPAVLVSHWVRPDDTGLLRLALGPTSASQERMGQDGDGFWVMTEATRLTARFLRRPDGRLGVCLLDPADEGTVRCLEYVASEPVGPPDVEVCEDLYSDYDCFGYRTNGTGGTLRGEGEVWMRAELF